MKETILEGAYVLLTVKYGYIRLLHTKADLCKEIQNVDLNCPIEKGKVSITKSVDLPKEIPPVWPPQTLSIVAELETDTHAQGKYTVEADVYTKDDDHITCLKATVWFNRRALGGAFDL